jgi:DNA-binding Xre family transcriptional regulator
MKDIETLRGMLARPNVSLSQLARDTGLNLRTLRRIKSGYTQDVMLDTIQRIEHGLVQQRQARRQAGLR